MCLAPALTCRIRKALENRTNMEDDRVAILEAQLTQAKLIAEESDKKYEEVNRSAMLVLSMAPVPAFLAEFLIKNYWLNLKSFEMTGWMSAFV